MDADKGYKCCIQPTYITYRGRYSCFLKIMYSMWAGPHPPLTNDTLPLAALLSNDCSPSVRSSPITFVKISFLKTLAAEEVLGYKSEVFTL